MMLVTLTGAAEGGQYSVYLDSFELDSKRRRVNSLNLIVVAVPPHRWHRSDWWKVTRYRLAMFRDRGWAPLRDSGNVGMPDADMDAVVRWVRVNAVQLSLWLARCPLSTNKTINIRGAATDDDFDSGSGGGSI